MNKNNFLNKTVLKYWWGRLKSYFASKTELEALDDRVDEIVAEGGEPNVLEKVKVNGVEQSVTNKTVDINVPTSTSDLTNNGDGDSPFATEDYVGRNGGKIDKIKVNGEEQAINNKEVDISMPTKVSDLTNDSEFIDKTVNNLENYYKKDESYTKSEVDNLVNTAISGGFVLVASLPTASANTMSKIYLIPSNNPDEKNIKDEYITIQEGGTYKWEPIGTTQLDLSNYWNDTNLIPITTAEIDEIMAE